MKKALLLSVVALSLGGCDIFTAQPQLFPVWTPLPSPTPGILSPTPIIIPLTSNATIVSSVTPVNSETPSATFTPVPVVPTETATTIPVQSVQVEILGCDTSIDITHGMGEVTNAYVTVKNTGTVDLPDTCALLRAIDEDREHPDKKKCVPDLPIQNQVTLKLTVDSAYQQATAIQVDTSSENRLLLRVERQSCTDIGLFGGAPADLGIIKAIQP